jgi:hypothetical protein
MEEFYEAPQVEVPEKKKSYLGSKFITNQHEWQILFRYQDWIMVSTWFVPPTGKAHKFYDTANIPHDHFGDEMVPISVGAENSLLNKSYDEIKARYERGVAKLKDDAQRIINNRQEEKAVRDAEEKRLSFIREGQTLSAHLKSELNDLYDRSDSYSAFAKNKRVQEILTQIALFDSWHFHNRHLINKI